MKSDTKHIAMPREVLFDPRPPAVRRQWTLHPELNSAVEYESEDSPDILRKIALEISNLKVKDFTRLRLELGTRVADRLALWSIKKSQAPPQPAPSDEPPDLPISMEAILAEITRPFGEKDK